MDSTTYNIALVLHLLGAITFFAGLAVAGGGFELARRREQPAEIALLLSLTRLGVLLVGVGTLVLAIFGLWMVHLGHWGYGAGWVDWAIGLFILALALGGLGGQRPKQARRLASRLAAEGAPLSPELRGLLDDRRSIAANYASLAVMVAIVVVMVFK